MNTIVFYFVHLHNIKETMHTLLVRLQVFYIVFDWSQI